MKNIVFLLLVFQFIQPVFTGIEIITEFIPYATGFLMIWLPFYTIFQSNKFAKSNRRDLSVLIYLLLLIFALITSALYNQFSIKSLVLIFSPLTCLQICSIYKRKVSNDFKPDTYIFKFAWVVWLTSVALQLFSPSIYSQFSSMFFVRSSIEIGERGLSGLATEPSFAAEVILLFYVVWRLKKKEFTSFENLLFVATLMLMVLLNGSATTYGFIFASIVIELIVTTIYFMTSKSPEKVKQKYLGESKFKTSITFLLPISVIFIAVFVVSGVSIPSRLSSIPSLTQQIDLSSFRGMIFMITYQLMGSWRSISNYAGYYMGLNNFPLGKGLGSGDLNFGDSVNDCFGMYDGSLHTWITTTFTFFPFVISDLGIFFFAGVMYLLFKHTKLLFLLQNYPIKGSMVILGIVCISIISPKSSLTPWFIMIYASDEHY